MDAGPAKVPYFETARPFLNGLRLSDYRITSRVPVMVTPKQVLMYTNTGKPLDQSRVPLQAVQIEWF